MEQPATTTAPLVTRESLEAISAKLVAPEPVSAVIAPPGTGKSTTVVHFLNSLGAKIFIVEPTVLACDNLQRYMKTLAKKNVGMAAEAKVNYHNAFISKIREGSSVAGSVAGATEEEIVYCTAGHMKKIMLDCVRYAYSKKKVTAIGETFEDVDLRFCHILMLDEAHSGSLDNDVIMHLYKFLHSHGAQLPKLLLSSATLDIQNTPFPSALHYQIPSVAYPVEIQWHPTEYSVDDPELYTATVQVIKDKHAQSAVPSDSSDVWLVFCAGAHEVETVISGLAGIPGLEAIPAYGNLGHDEASKIFSPVPLGTRRVIAATNIAETAITINNLSGEFDTLAEKYGEESSSGGFRLSLHQISKSSAKQRAGRVGRTCPGFCYRMTTQFVFDTKFAESRPREIERVPLHTTMIELLDVGINPLQLFGDKIRDFRIGKAEAMLRGLSMYTVDPITVTEKGRFATEFPFSVRGSAILYEWTRLLKEDKTPYPVFPALVFVSIIETFGPSYFWYPKKTPGEKQGDYLKRVLEHHRKNFLQYDGDNDLAVLGNLWSEFYQSSAGQALANLIVDKRLIGDFSRARSLNNRKMIELCNNIRTSVQTLKRLRFNVTIGAFNCANVLAIMLPLIKAAYSDRLYTKEGRGSVYRSTTPPHPFFGLGTQQPIKYPPAQDNELIGLIIFENMGRGSAATRIISLSMPSSAVSQAPSAHPVPAPAQKFVPRPARPVMVPQGSVGLVIAGKTVILPTIDLTSAEYKVADQPKYAVLRSELMLPDTTAPTFDTIPFEGLQVEQDPADHVVHETSSDARLLGLPDGTGPQDDSEVSEEDDE